MFIALDPDAEALKKYAFRAARKPSRGGVQNALFVAGAVEEPPPELAGLADEVHVVFAWAALLRGLLRPDASVLRGLATLAKPGALFELILTYDAAHDHGAGVDPETPTLDLDYVEGLRAPFGAAGLRITDIRVLTRAEALAIPSTWGLRLLHGRPRTVILARGRVAEPAGDASGPEGQLN